MNRKLLIANIFSLVTALSGFSMDEEFPQGHKRTREQEFSSDEDEESREHKRRRVENFEPMEEEEDLTPSEISPLTGFNLRHFGTIQVTQHAPQPPATMPVYFNNYGYAPRVLPPLPQYGAPHQVAVAAPQFTCGDVVCQAKKDCLGKICRYNQPIENIKEAIQSGDSNLLNQIPSGVLPLINSYIVHPQRCGGECNINSNDIIFSYCNDRFKNNTCTFQGKCVHNLSRLNEVIADDNNLFKRIPSELLPLIECHLMPLFTCEVIGCGKQFYREAAFKKHNQKLHPKGFPYICLNHRLNIIEFETKEEYDLHCGLVCTKRY